MSRNDALQQRDPRKQQDLRLEITDTKHRPVELDRAQLIASLASPQTREGDANLLADCIATVKLSTEHAATAALALFVIQEKKLYLRSIYKTWERFVTEIWEISRAHAARLISFAKVIQVLAPTGIKLLPNERQARDLKKAKLTEEQTRSVWRNVVYSETEATARRRFETEAITRSNLDRELAKYPKKAIPPQKAAKAYVKETYRLPADLAKALEKAAKAGKISKNEFVTNVLAEHLARVGTATRKHPIRKKAGLTG